jgi:O-antigen ligase
MLPINMYTWGKSKSSLGSVLGYLLPLCLSLALPNYVEEMCSIYLGTGGLWQFWYLVGAIVLLFLPIKRNVYWPMFLMGGYVVMLAFVQACILDTASENVIAVGVGIGMLFIAASFVDLNVRSIKFMGLIFLGVLMFVGLQVVLFTFGMVSMVSPKSGYVIGHEGVITRAVTTIAAPTGTGVALFLIGGVLIESMRLTLVIRALVMGLILTIIALLCARGSLLMCFVYFLGNIMISRELRRAGFMWKSFGFGLILLLAYFLVFRAGSAYSALAESRAEGFWDDTGRYERYYDAYNAFRQKPVIGWGVGCYQPRSWTIEREGYVGETSPHNVYLLLLAEGGFALFLPYLVFLIYVFYDIMRRGGYSKLLFYTCIVVIGHQLEIVYWDLPVLGLYLIAIKTLVETRVADLGRHSYCSPMRMLPH